MELSIVNIEKILIKEDIEGFIVAGSPEDEYYTEAKYIARALLEIDNHDFTEENIMAVISALWANSFNLSKEDVAKRLPALSRVVSYIMES